MVGFGYDSHILAEGKPLILGGLRIESDFGTIAHSDGDVVLHTLCDALLGSAGLGDIGELFPDSDSKYKGADSRLFISQIMKLLDDRNLFIINLDITILLEKPKLKNYKDKIRQSISELVNISAENVNIKAKTNEGMGFIGRQEGLAAYCICEIQLRV
jgi:2-C-methyl-D-erythritol 2,4-cyclodiphosphate synthase